MQNDYDSIEINDPFINDDLCFNNAHLDHDYYFTMESYMDTISSVSSTAKVKKKANKSKAFKCPVCKRPYVYKNAMYEHVQDAHGELISDGMSVAQFCFNIRNKKEYGLCVQCRTNKTKWNEEAERYERFCSEECKNKYVAEAKSRMLKKYGKEHLLDDPDQQKKMQDSRKISGKYVFQKDNSEAPYQGSYELDFLKTCDVMLNLTGKDICRCPYVFEYEYEGAKHLYLPDYYLPNFNLIVEIKDGGDNPNKHPKIQEVDKVKEHLKDAVMMNQNKYNYIKITNKDYNSFAYVINLIKDISYDNPEYANSECAIVVIGD